MRRSLESSRPILSKNDPNNKRASTRFSTYSSATSNSAYTEKSYNEKTLISGMSNSNEPRASNDLSKYKSGLDRMASKPLESQRYVPSSEKDEMMDKLALAGKVSKALDRRYSSQDAEWKPKTAKKPSKLSEKSG